MIAEISGWLITGVGFYRVIAVNVDGAESNDDKGFWVY